MFKYLLIFFCLSIFQKDTQTAITWSEDYKLKWSDFKGQPDYNTKASAITAAGLSYRYSLQKKGRDIVGFKSDISALFYPEYSWFKTDEISNHILAHEQVHFDITELHARYFRARAAQLTASNTIVEDLKFVHDSINKALEIMQRQYDQESQFSLDKEGQMFWSKHVALALKKTSSYKTP
jgi:hypothetical protein